MGKIYWNLPEISIPDGCYTNRFDGRVYIISKDGEKSKKRTVIGMATSEEKMHVNDMFRHLFPKIWNTEYGEEKTLQHELRYGLYATLLGIGYQTNIYPKLQEIYGPQNGNAIMDFIMYLLLERDHITSLYDERMKGHLLFSDKVLSDSWYSSLFKDQMSENLNHKFREAWIEIYAKNNVSKVWLSIDGSNTDANIKESDYCEKGSAKSNINTNIVSYIWAINVDDGMPVTYCINNGSKVDAKAFQEIITILNASDITIEGVIVDRGFANSNVLETLQEMGLEYVVMLPSFFKGHEKMMEEYAQKIFWNVEYLIDRKGIFGITDKKQVFGSNQKELNIGLFFDAKNGASRSLSHIADMMDAIIKIQEIMDKGKVPIIPQKYEELLEIVTDNENTKLSIKYTKWQKIINKKGFYSIASSKELSAKDIYAIYYLRDISEKVFRMMKSAMGFDAIRVHSDTSLLSKFTLCFIATLFRTKFMKNCQELGYDTNKMIMKLDQVSMVLLPNQMYATINDLSLRQYSLLQSFGINSSDGSVFAEEANVRLQGKIHSQVHKLPDDPERFMRNKGGRPRKYPQKEISELTEKRGRGRPKGSKNKKTLEREKNEVIKTAQKRKPGRPKGSKNKTKSKRHKKSEIIIPVEKRERGRPKGSKNKPKIIIHRGRPKGSKNKPKMILDA